MKKVLIFGVLGLFLSFNLAWAAKDSCTTIQSGELLASDGSVIATGYDKWGYNYQAHMFNGKYCDAYRDASWCQAYKNDDLIMKWNDAWLSNKDCSGDKLLDRYYGYPSYIGSGAWLTNHMKGEYEGTDGETCRWSYFAKIVAKPSVGFSCAEMGGEEIWGSFCQIMTVDNDSCTGKHGVDLKAISPGFGAWR
ncbi:MAG: hypothetical protein ACOYS2_03500 [Patescibacteria group bacterium]